jgi:hypothetical protein
LDELFLLDGGAFRLARRDKDRVDTVRRRGRASSRKVCAGRSRSGADLRGMMLGELEMEPDLTRTMDVGGREKKMSSYTPRSRTRPKPCHATAAAEA